MIINPISVREAIKKHFNIDSELPDQIFSSSFDYYIFMPYEIVLYDNDDFIYSFQQFLESIKCENIYFSSIKDSTFNSFELKTPEVLNNFNSVLQYENDKIGLHTALDIGIFPEVLNLWAIYIHNTFDLAILGCNKKFLFELNKYLKAFSLSENELDIIISYTIKPRKKLWFKSRLIKNYYEVIWGSGLSFFKEAE